MKYCLTCDKPIKYKIKSAKYCSNFCLQKAYRDRKKNVFIFPDDLDKIKPNSSHEEEKTI